MLIDMFSLIGFFSRIGRVYRVLPSFSFCSTRNARIEWLRLSIDWISLIDFYGCSWIRSSLLRFHWFFSSIYLVFYRVLPSFSLKNDERCFENFDLDSIEFNIEVTEFFFQESNDVSMIENDTKIRRLPSFTEFFFCLLNLKKTLKMIPLLRNLKKN